MLGTGLHKYYFSFFLIHEKHAEFYKAYRLFEN